MVCLKKNEFEMFGLRNIIRTLIDGLTIEIHASSKSNADRLIIYQIMKINDCQLLTKMNLINEFEWKWNLISAWSMFLSVNLCIFMNIHIVFCRKERTNEYESFLSRCCEFSVRSKNLDKIMIITIIHSILMLDIPISIVKWIFRWYSKPNLNIK